MTDLYNKFQELIISGDINDADNLKYKTLLNTYIKPMQIHWSMVYYLPFASYTIANKGVFKHTSENANTLEKLEIDYLVEKERDIAQRILNQMEKEYQEYKLIQDKEDEKWARDFKSSKYAKPSERMANNYEIMKDFLIGLIG